MEGGPPLMNPPESAPPPSWSALVDPGPAAERLVRERAERLIGVSSPRPSITLPLIELGREVATRRLQSGMSVEELAAALRLDSVMLSLFEEGLLGAEEVDAMGLWLVLRKLGLDAVDATADLRFGMAEALLG